MYAVVATRLDGAQQFDLVEPVGAVAAGNTVEPRRNLVFVVVDADVKRTERPEHSVHRADLRGHFFDLGRIKRLPRRRRQETIQPAVLIAGEDASLRVHAEIDP